MSRKQLYSTKEKTEKEKIIMGDRFDISIDLAEGEDKSVSILCCIDDNGEYHPVKECDYLYLADGTQYKGEGVKCGSFTFRTTTSEENIRALAGYPSAEYLKLSTSFSKMLESVTKANALLKRIMDIRKGMKRRKTTFKTIKRNCAKRNR